MAFGTNTIGSYNHPFKAKDSHKSPEKITMLQTVTTGTTQGVLRVIGTATVENECHLVSLHVSVVDPTAASTIAIHYGSDIIASAKNLFTSGSAPISMNFGTMGLIGGTTTTATVDVVTAGGTATVYAVATYYTTASSTAS